MQTTFEIDQVVNPSDENLATPIDLNSQGKRQLNSIMNSCSSTLNMIPK